MKLIPLSMLVPEEQYKKLEQCASEHGEHIQEVVLNIIKDFIYYCDNPEIFTEEEITNEKS